MSQATQKRFSKAVNKNTDWKINVKKIGIGSRFRAGSFSSKKNIGLKGQIGALRRQGKHTFGANISQKNEQQMYDIISPYLKNKPATSKVPLTRRDIIKIRHDAWNLVKTKGSDFTREDMKDLIEVAMQIKDGAIKQIIPQKRNNNENATEVTEIINKIKNNEQNEKQNQNNNNPKRQEILSKGYELRKKYLKENPRKIPGRNFQTAKNRLKKYKNNSEINNFKNEFNNKQDQDDVEIKLPDPKSVKDLPI